MTIYERNFSLEIHIATCNVIINIVCVLFDFMGKKLAYMGSLDCVAYARDFWFQMKCAASMRNPNLHVRFHKVNNGPKFTFQTLHVATHTTN